MSDKKHEFEDIEMLLSEFEKKGDGKVSDNKNKDKSINKKHKTSKKGSGKKKSVNGKKEPSKFMLKWKALEKWKRVTIIVVAVILLLALVAVGVVYGVYNGFRTNVNEENLGISSEIEDKYGKTDVFNIAIFGVDTRDENAFTGRSDSIIIVSVDKNKNDVKITSILRDSYVPIEGHGSQKITHAYAFGGAELAIKTINQNFNMNITDYATINFYKLADAIDVLGGIDINITESEMEQINSEAIGGSQKGAALLSDYGDVHLDGDQASIYTRLRHSDSDEMRSQRQKNVINALITQAKKVSPSKYAEVVKTIMSLCETSLSFSEVMSFAPMITQEISISAITVPGEPENAIGGLYDGAWVWRYDVAAAAERIHLFIYGEVPETTTSVTTTKKSSSKTTTTKATTTKQSTGADNETSTTTAPTTTLPAPETSAPVTTEPANETQSQPAVQTTAADNDIEQNTQQNAA